MMQSFISMVDTQYTKLYNVSIPGNLATIYVLQRRHSNLDLNPTFSNLLVCLAVFDSLFLLLANLVYTVTAVLHPRQVRRGFHFILRILIYVFRFLQSEIQMMATPYLIPLTNISLTGK